MDKVFRKLLLVAAVSLLGWAPSALADSSVYVNGSYAFGNNGYGIPPYGGTLNGQSAEFYCVDFSHDISGGDSWLAIPTAIGPSANYGSTYLGSATIDGYSDYLIFAYIITEMQGTSSELTQAEDQWAIWSVTDGSVGDPYGNAASIFSAAAAGIGSSGFTGQGWEILTPDAKLNQYGQEFLVYTPEPSVVLLLAVGLCGLVFLKRRDRLLS